jgi:iron complex transport system ATP-binding protein
MSVAYGARQVLHQVSLPALPAGSLVALVGPNGAGKSTLLRALAGLERMQGSLTLDGAEVTRLGVAERSRRLAYMPQQLPPGIALGVLESIIAGLRVGGADNPLGTAFEALRRLGIEHLAEQPLASLSGGSGNWWRWPSCWRATLGYCCWTSRPARWTCITSCG